MGMRRALATLLSRSAAAARQGRLPQREEVIFLPSVGVPQADGSWLLDLHGRVVAPERGSLKRRALLALLARTLGPGDSAAATRQRRALVQERLRPFLAARTGGRRLTVGIAGRQATLEGTGSDSPCRAQLTLDAASAARHCSPGGILPYAYGPLPDDPRVFPGAVHLIPSTGVSVISDLDDTLKITGCHDRRETLRRTFLEPFAAVPGMAGLYQAWARQGARFHLVSASPWQLFPHLEPFLHQAGFPPMSWHLGTVRWTRQGLDRLSREPEAHKAAVIPELLASFPDRRFVLVGDSGQQDPEAYARLAHAHANVALILIRDLAGSPLVAQRCRLAFQGLPASSWALFTDAAMVSERLPR